MRDLATGEYNCAKFTSSIEGESEITISYWQSDADILAWKNDADHLATLKLGQDK